MIVVIFEKTKKTCRKLSNMIIWHSTNLQLERWLFATFPQIWINEVKICWKNVCNCAVLCSHVTGYRFCSIIHVNIPIRWILHDMLHFWHDKHKFNLENVAIRAAEHFVSANLVHFILCLFLKFNGLALNYECVTSTSNTLTYTFII